ncbi:hypothetical protein LZC95_22680 [Pendulispora brunnea]|uniref:DUF2029 domain-containing protein n=1 Tax=Pendulispora brunnea TaxID=2905690 RepID=A0ABZ2KQM0_9BACT
MAIEENWPLALAPRARTGVVTWTVRLGFVALVAGVLATTVFALGLLHTRPVMPGEAEVLFEAARMHAHLPLFTDPRAGTFEYGSYASRFYVLYPPIWSWVVSFVPPEIAQPIARFVGCAAWFGVLAWISQPATPRCRPAAMAGALYVAGVFVLANFATTARPDAIAVALAALALDRCVRRQRLDGWSVALFCTAAVLKPNVMGAMIGVFVASVITAPRYALRNIAMAILLGAAWIDVLEIASNGVWHEHFVCSFGQPRSLALAASGAVSRLPLLGGLLATAAWLAWRHRYHRGIALGLGALAGAFAWACLAFSRPGSASNYWLETCAVCVVILAHAPLPDIREWSGTTARLAAIAFAAQAIYNAGAAWEGTLESFEKEPARARLAQFARENCRAEPNDVIVADEPGFELETNDRILATVFTMNAAVRAGKLPLETAVSDAKRPEVRCVMSAHGEFGAFLPEVRDIFRDRFRLMKEEGDWKLYAHR